MLLLSAFGEAISLQFSGSNAVLFFAVVSAFHSGTPNICMHPN
jgi:hypothetical protein